MYVNNALVSRSNIPSGPFSITNIPIITGQGDVNVVVTDILGREHVINMPSYGSSAMLKSGITSNSFETGFVRNNFGTKSNSYGSLFFTGNFRKGISDVLTREFRTELSRHMQTIGAGGTLLLKNRYVINASAAISHASGSNGAFGLVGIQHTGISDLSYGMNIQATTRQFTRLGVQSDSLLPSLQSQWFIAFPVGKTSYNIGYTQQINRGQSNSQFVTFSASRVIAHHWSLNLAGLSNLGGTTNKSILLTVTRALDARDTVSSGFTAQTEASQAQLQVQRSLPTDTGYGYNMSLAQGSETSYVGTLSAQNSVGNYYITAARQAGQTGYQADMSGALSIMEDWFHFSRTLTDSFGVVILPGIRDVPVYLNNQVIGKTSASGSVFIPSMLPYNRNVISVKPSDIPLNATIESAEVNVIPYYRSGTVVHFPVHSAMDGLVSLKLPSGQPVPAGAMVSLAGTASVFPVGEKGMVYLTGLLPKNHLRAVWGTASCTFDLKYKPRNTPVPDLGSFICK